MQIKLKNCEKCGSNKIVIYSEGNKFSVQCEKCGRTNHCKTDTITMAINCWNKNISKS